MNAPLKQVASYAWIGKTQRSWHLWMGNPFVVGKKVIPLNNATEKQLTSFARRANQKEKKRFTKKFPSIQWVD